MLSPLGVAERLDEKYLQVPDERTVPAEPEAVWNVVAFYLFLLKLPPWLGAFVVVALAVLTFVPFHVVHPVRIAHMRAITGGPADNRNKVRIRTVKAPTSAARVANMTPSASEGALAAGATGGAAFGATLPVRVPARSASRWHAGRCGSCSAKS